MDAFTRSNEAASSSYVFDLTFVEKFDWKSLIEKIKILFKSRSQNSAEEDEKAIVRVSSENTDKSMNMFTFTFDECHELLKKPSACKSEEGNELISLYRIIRRVMMELKELPIVSVTKSSLSDFVLNAPTHPSVREFIDSPTEWFDVPTYIFAESVDVAFFESVVLSYESLSLYSSEYDNFVRIPNELKKLALVCGRPLWSNFDDNFLKAFTTAEYKLSCNESNLVHLTGMILRTGSSIQPQDRLLINWFCQGWLQYYT